MSACSFCDGQGLICDECGIPLPPGGYRCCDVCRKDFCTPAPSLIGDSPFMSSPDHFAGHGCGDVMGRREVVRHARTAQDLTSGGGKYGGRHVYQECVEHPLHCGVLERGGLRQEVESPCHRREDDPRHFKAYTHDHAFFNPSGNALCAYELQAGRYCYGLREDHPQPKKEE